MAPNHTKFHPPLSGQDGVARERLLARLDRQADVHLVLLLAPAGYGKTTLMGQWMERIRNGGGHAGWLTFDEADNDPARLMCYLYGALREWMLMALGPDGAGAQAADWMSLLDRIGPNAPPYTLFLDEFEKVGAEPALRIVRLLAERLPRTVRLVISSRDKPAIGIERHRVRGDLLELTAGDLRFGPDETKRFFSGRIAEPLAAWLVEKMQDITDGWPAALQLTALAARSKRELERYASDLSGSLAHIADYLAEDVLHAQPAEVRSFLLETCGFPRLSTAACNAATGRTDSQNILQYLERHGLFTTSLDASHSWYRYHPLFAEFLRTQQARELPREQVVATHRGAARWFARHGTAVEAVDLWLLAGDSEAAIREMSSCAHTLVMQAQFGTILRWIARLPESAFAEAGPELALAAAWACGFGGEPDAALRWLKIVSQAPQAGGAQSRLHDELAALETVLLALRGDIRGALDSGLARWQRIDTAHRFAAGALANVISYCLMFQGDFARARSFSNEARMYNEEIGSALGLGYALAVSGMIEAIQGNLDQALEQFHEIDRMAAAQLRHPWFETTHIKVASAGLIASVLYEKDRLDEADELLQRYHPLVMHQPSVDMLVLSHIIYARLKLVQGDVNGALAVLQRAHQNTAAGWHSARAHRLIEWERFRIDLNLNGPERALARAALPQREEADEGGGGAGNWFAEELCGGGIESIRCAVARGESAEALLLLDGEIALARQQGRRWRLLKLLLLQALAFDAQGSHDAARAALAQALHLGWRIGARRSFMDEGRRLETLLAELPPQSLVRLPDADAVMRYWRDLRGESPALDAAPAALGAGVLSDREHAILKLLASGMGNEQIANAVFLSVNTVKWHIRRILEKLNARNRSEAVFVARQLGLIDV
ncbi:MAG TPA: LuxR C-terminal-related transcriptional regulator [Noviherbaspirillum sp.]|nr:LuxR C-terminal-related transcriptional regulator [Noviherbaspirillum sp.]